MMPLGVLLIWIIFSAVLGACLAFGVAGRVIYVPTLPTDPDPPRNRLLVRRSEETPAYWLNLSPLIATWLGLSVGLATIVWNWGG